MRLELNILRRSTPDEKPYMQRFFFETEDAQMTVAAALTALNSKPLQDAEGNPAAPIRWECSCMQKKCGACAMRINGVPRLACDVKLTEFAKKGSLTLEPLRKFPVVADLIVDRSILMQNLKILQIWFNEDTKADEKVGALAYDAARCLQCGCCLEVCPNFYEGGNFYGMAAVLPAARLITSLPESQKKAIFRAYREHLYEGCGKSFACRNICPAGIDIDRLLVNTNAAAVWKRRFR